MKEIVTQIELECSDLQAWECLMDFEKYPEWNPFIRQIAGETRVGQFVEVTIQPPGGSPMKFKSQVLVAEGPVEFRWKGKFLMSGLYDGEHYFKIETLEPGRIRFTQGEKFGGLLEPVINGLMGGKVQKGFEAMNQAFKKRLETKV
jgi:hypothetical protein